MIDLVCANGHQLVKGVVCPDCGQKLVLASKSSGRDSKEIVAVCWYCWKGQGRNWIIRDILKVLNLKKCQKCDSVRFFFIKKR